MKIETTLISTFVMNIIVNATYLLMVNDSSFRVEPTALMSGVNVFVFAVMVLMSVRAFKQFDAKYVETLNREVDKYENLFNGQNKTGEEFVKAQVKIKKLETQLVAQEETLTKSKAEATTLKEVTNKARDLKEQLETVETDRAEHRNSSQLKTSALQYMSQRLGRVASEAWHAPTTDAGPALKEIRFAILRAAMEGFRGLGEFTWQGQQEIDSKVYRDFVQEELGKAAQGEGMFDPTKPWVANMILAAHDKSADKNQKG